MLADVCVEKLHWVLPCVYIHEKQHTPNYRSAQYTFHTDARSELGMDAATLFDSAVGRRHRRKGLRSDEQELGPKKISYTFVSTPSSWRLNCGTVREGAACKPLLFLVCTNQTGQTDGISGGCRDKTQRLLRLSPRFPSRRCGCPIWHDLE